MKKLIIMSAIAMSGFIYNTADAQIGIRVGLHFGTRPIYRPAPVVVEQAPVYDNNDYYYLPDVNAYYNVDEQCYYYYDGDNWISAEYLPGAYRDYDWRNERHFEVRANRPYMHNDFYRTRYNGHAVGEWSHNNYDNHFDRGYANRGNRENYQRFENHGQINNERHYDDGGNRANAQRYDNREQRFAQPVPSYRNQGNDQRFDNRNQGNFAQPNRNQGNEQRINSQPSSQNQGQENRGGGDHYAHSNPQGGFSDHRMSRF
jgi:hypothetical protein